MFDLLWNYFYHSTFDDEFKNKPSLLKERKDKEKRPYEGTLLEGLLRDSSYKFVDNIETPQQETLPDMVTAAFKKAVAELKQLESKKMLEWAKYKSTGVNHLTKIPAFNRKNISTGGGKYCINATKEDHGPSWRMVVSLTEETEAYGVYPGGQNGNPGSKFYDMFVDKWAEGKYYTLWMMKKGESG